MSIDTYLVPASTGWNKSQAFDLRFKFLQQIICQAHGLFGIVSNCAVSDLDLQHGGISSSSTPKIILLLTQIRWMDFLRIGGPWSMRIGKGVMVWLRQTITPSYSQHSVDFQLID